MSAEKCLSCSKGFENDTQHLVCSLCKKWFHVGKCSGVLKKKLKSMTSTAVRGWKCERCTNKELESSSESEESGEENAMRAKDLSKQISEISKMLGTVLSRLEGLEKKVDRQCTTTEAIEKSMELLAAKYDELLVKNAEHEKQIDSLNKVSAELSTKLAEKEAEIAQLKVTVNNVEQYSRRKNIEIHGVAQLPEEDLHQVLLDLSRKLEIKAPEKQSVEAIHRLKAKQDKIPAIIVRFRDQEERDLWLSKKKALRNERIFINENLTTALKQLFWQCRQVGKQKNYKFVWMSNGKIFARKIEGATGIRINTENDLEKLV